MSDTPTPFGEWLAEAERLADEYATIGERHGRGIFSIESLQAARAALSAHLVRVPMGEPVAWAHIRDADMVRNLPANHVGHPTELFKVEQKGLHSKGRLPLYTKPEGMG